MQRGTIRARSPSPSASSGNDIGADPRDRTPASSPLSAPSAKRARHVSPSASSARSPVASPVVVSSLPTSPPRLATGMGRTSNGAGSSSNGASNGHHAPALAMTMGEVVKRTFETRLMYDDDKDWAEEHADDAMDVDERGVAHSGEGESSTARRPTGKRMPIDREEFVRLVLQGLRDIGYDQSAATLEAESGYTLASQPALDLQAAILGGRWSESLSLLSQLGILSDTPPPDEPASSSSSSVRSGKSKAVAGGHGTKSDAIRFLISQQKYFEMLELGQQKKALAVLRTELAPVIRDPDVLHTLTTYMMTMDRDELFERAQWDGAAGSSRRRLLEALQQYISPDIMVPSRRLATLFDQARRLQLQSCLYHVDTEPFSLYTDHECHAGSFPSVTTHILADHTDEVHVLAWSPDGTLLASAGGDKQVVIWQLQRRVDGGSEQEWTVVPLHHLKEHPKAVGVLAWSPDGQTLAVGSDRTLYLWDTMTGMKKALKTGTSQHSDEISAIRWYADGSAFIVSSLDHKLVTYSADGEAKRILSSPGVQVGDFALTPDQKRLVLCGTLVRRRVGDPGSTPGKPRPAMSGRTVHDPVHGISEDPVVDFGYEQMESCLVLVGVDDGEVVDVYSGVKGDISSLEMSADGKRVLVSTCGDGVQVLSIEPTIRLMRRYTGHVQERYLLRSAFGAGKDRFIVSGSEDGQVYVYQTSSSHPIEVLSGHSAAVNAVAWNPVLGLSSGSASASGQGASRPMLASCSDDQTVRIWQPPVDLDTTAGAGAGRRTGLAGTSGAAGRGDVDVE